MVAFEDTGDELLQAKLLERVSRPQGHRFTGDTTTPPRLVANDCSGDCVSAAPVNLGDTGAADVLPVREEAAGNIGVAA